MSTIFVICGQSATGKSDLAVELSLYKNKQGKVCEVISADSRQVYRGLVYSSNQTMPSQMQAVSHHLIGHIPPGSRYNVKLFQSEARTIVQDILGRSHIPIICGGTGLFIDATLFKSYDFNRSGSISYCVNDYFWEDAQIIWVGLQAPRSFLQERIRNRAIAHYHHVINEINFLLSLGISRDWLHGLGLEPRLALSVIDGIMSKEEYIDQLSSLTYKYTKRQLTWFKRNANIHWFDVEKTSTADIVEQIIRIEN